MTGTDTLDSQEIAEAPVVRLSVNLSPDVAQVLRVLVGRKGVSFTEGIRRALACWKYLEEQKVLGNRIAIIETGHRGGPRVREVNLID